MENLLKMDINTMAFYLLTGISLSSVIMILFTKNIIRAIFLLVVVFVGIAGIYMISQAEFVAVTQILVYVGGILILLMFGIMLTNRIEGQQLVSGNKRLIPGVIVSGLLFYVLVSSVFTNVDGFKTEGWIVYPPLSSEFVKDFEPPEPALSSTQTIGINLMTNQVIALEITAILLLIALVGAAFIVGNKMKLKIE